MRAAIYFAYSKNNFSPNLGIRNPQVSSSLYERVICVAFWTLRVWNPNLQLVFITNIPPRNIEEILKKLGVETLLVNFNHQPAESASDTFRSSFYLLDVILSLNTSTLLLDPDIICLAKLEDFNYIYSTLGFFNTGFECSKSVNGITIASARAAAHECGIEISNLTHFGGEAIWIPSNYLDFVQKRISFFWPKILQQMKDSDTFLTTEEHILSCLFGDSSYVELNKHIQRIWTGLRYRRVRGENVDLYSLDFWHLPAEKAFGFQSAFDKIAKSDFRVEFEKAKFRDWVESEFMINLFHRKSLNQIKKRLINKLGLNIRSLQI